MYYLLFHDASHSITPSLSLCLHVCMFNWVCMFQPFSCRLRKKITELCLYLIIRQALCALNFIFLTILVLLVLNFRLSFSLGGLTRRNLNLWILTSNQCKWWGSFSWNSCNLRTLYFVYVLIWICILRACNYQSFFLVWSIIGRNLKLCMIECFNGSWIWF